jgi:hypothetical protein
MRRILYIPWIKEECPEIVNDAHQWVNSYSTRQYTVEKSNTLVPPKDIQPLAKEASPKKFELMIYDPARKDQFKELKPVSDISNLDQIYILGHGDPELSTLEIYPQRNASSTGLLFFQLTGRVIDHEGLPDDFNGRVKLFVCKGGIGPKPLKGPAPENPQANSFAQLFGDDFLKRRPSAKLYAYTESLVNSHETSKHIAFKALWDESSKQVKVGAAPARVEIKTK